MDDLSELARRVGQALERNRLVLATAESCTGGWVAQTVTSIPGSSGWFDRGFVTYSNLAKEQMLGVQPQTLQAHGAVSEEVAAEMARGAVARSAAQIGVAITGVAGPDGGSEEKPVGTVWIAWAHRDGGVRTQVGHFAGDREAVRRRSVREALLGVLDLADGTPAR